MPAYFIVEIQTTNTTAMGDYRERVASVIEKFGGRYLVRGGDCQTFEGDWTPERLVILEFPTREAALTFWQSKDYEPLRDIRRNAGRSKVILANGYVATAT
jgi:uncharacterized protein (DUF1330 family)